MNSDQQAPDPGDAPKRGPNPGLDLPFGKYWSREELAGKLNVTKRTVSEWIARPDGLPHMKLGRNYYFKPDDVRDWLERKMRSRNRLRRARAQGCPE
jgi:excisionase family DNA binding protein